MAQKLMGGYSYLYQQHASLVLRCTTTVSLKTKIFYLNSLKSTPSEMTPQAADLIILRVEISYHFVIELINKVESKAALIGISMY